MSRIFPITFTDLERGAGTQIQSYVLDLPATSEPPTRHGKRGCLTLRKRVRDSKADRWRKRTEEMLVSKAALASQGDKAWHRWLHKEPAG